MNPYIKAQLELISKEIENQFFPEKVLIEFIQGSIKEIIRNEDHKLIPEIEKDRN